MTTDKHGLRRKWKRNWRRWAGMAVGGAMLFQLGPCVDIELPALQLVVQTSVAVNPSGVSIGGGVDAGSFQAAR